MTRYVIFKEFGNMFLTDENNYDAYVRNASKIINVNNFESAEAVRDYLIREWKLLPEQIIIAWKN